MVPMAGLEPATYRLSGECSTLELHRQMVPTQRLELCSPGYKSGTSPSTLSGPMLYLLKTLSDFIISSSNLALAVLQL